MSILGRIVEETREELRASRLDLAEFRRAAEAVVRTKPRHAFRDALATPAGSRETRVIAEIKAASPSLGQIVESPDVEAIAASYRDGGAAAVSVVTEPRHFRGRREWLDRAARAAGLPVIMKDFVVEPVQIYRGAAAGAEAILLLASILDGPRIAEFIAICDELGRDALVEVHDEHELERAIAGGARMIGVNNRNLSDFSVELGTSERLGRVMPSGVVKVSESGIRSREDVVRLLDAGFNAFLVGESILRSDDRARAIRSLLGQTKGSAGNAA